MLTGKSIPKCLVTNLGWFKIVLCCKGQSNVDNVKNVLLLLLEIVKYRDDIGMRADASSLIH